VLLAPHRLSLLERYSHKFCAVRAAQPRRPAGAAARERLPGATNPTNATNAAPAQSATLLAVAAALQLSLESNRVAPTLEEAARLRLLWEPVAPRMFAQQRPSAGPAGQASCAGGGRVDPDSEGPLASESSRGDGHSAALAARQQLGAGEVARGVG